MSTPLLLVPGLMCDHTVWEGVASQLGHQHLCRVVDHGQADNIQVMAQQMLADAPYEMLLAGHSMGARVVVEAVRLAPHRVRGVALLDTGYSPRPGGSAGLEEANKRMALLEIAQKQSVRAMAKVWAQGMVHPNRRSDQALMDSILAMFERKTAATFAHQIQALLNRPDGTDVLKGIQVPTLVLCGEQDAWSPVAQHQAMHDLIPGSNLVLIEQAGHMAPMERPAEVAKALSNWLEICDRHLT